MERMNRPFMPRSVSAIRRKHCQVQVPDVDILEAAVGGLYKAAQAAGGEFRGLGRAERDIAGARDGSAAEREGLEPRETVVGSPARAGIDRPSG